MDTLARGIYLPVLAGHLVPGGGGNCQQEFLGPVIAAPLTHEVAGIGASGIGRDLVEPEALLPPREAAPVNGTSGPHATTGHHPDRVLLDHPSKFDFSCFFLVNLLTVSAIAAGSKRSLDVAGQHAAAAGKKGRKKSQEASEGSQKVITVWESVASVLLTGAVTFALIVAAWTFQWENLDFSLYYLFEWTAIYSLLSPFCDSVPFFRKPMHLEVARKDNKSVVVNWSFRSAHLYLLALDAVVVLLYLYTRHWILQDLLSLAAAIVHVSGWSLGSVRDGVAFAVIFLAQDLFWSVLSPQLLGTRPVDDCCRRKEMVGNVVVPHLFSVPGSVIDHSQAFFGVGDIVVPGLFIALLLNFDKSRPGQPQHNLYFLVALASYVCGVSIAFLFTDICGNKQPLLPFVVPLTVGVPILLSLAKREFWALLHYDTRRGE